MSDEQFKKQAEHEAETTKDVTGPLAISPELLQKTKRKYTRKVKPVVITTIEESTKSAPRNWYCSSCRETFSDTTVMKMGAGTNRFSVFCPNCQKSLGFQDQVMLNTIAKLIRENPTGK